MWSKGFGALLRVEGRKAIGMTFFSRFGFERNKISLFRAHQNRQIQDRVSEEKAIMSNNSTKKVDAFSSETNPVEIENFDIFYGSFESVHSEGEGRNRKIVRTMRRYDVPSILMKKLGQNYANIVYFLRARGLKMKSAELIYILSYFLKNKQSFMQLLEQEPQIFEGQLVKALGTVNIYTAEEFIRLVRLADAFGVEDLAVWRNLLVKGNLLLQNDYEVENMLESICVVFRIFMSVPFTDLASQGLVLQMKKRILKAIPSIDVGECVALLFLIAEKSMFIDENQLRKFEDKFLANQEVLSMSQFAMIFDSFGRIGFSSFELVTYFLKQKFLKIERIIKNIVSAPANKQEGVHEETKEEEGEGEREKGDSENNSQVVERSKDHLDQKIAEVTVFSSESCISIQDFVWLIRGFSKNSVAMSKEELWLKFERMLLRFHVEFGVEGKMNELISKPQAQSIIGSFSSTKMGSVAVWELLSNRSELDLSYDENYTILFHLNRHNVQSISQLNLALSYILDDATDLPMFDCVLGKEPAQKILEKLETYSMVIYRYIEMSAKGGRDAELRFQKRCMEELLRQSVNILMSNMDRRWKDLNERESIKLYGILHLCEFKSGFNVTSKIGALERSIQKERHTYGMKEVAFLTLMQESFASEEQYSKWSNFIFKCVQNASQLEFASYLSIFYKHGLGDVYLWSLFLVKYIEQIELFNVSDLLVGMLVFLQKIEIEEEIWELFLEVIRIKVHVMDLEELQVFAGQTSCMKKEQRLSIESVIQELEEKERNKKEKSGENPEDQEDDQSSEMDDFDFFESQGLSLKVVAEKREPLSVHSSQNIRYVLNLID